MAVLLYSFCKVFISVSKLSFRLVIFFLNITGLLLSLRIALTCFKLRILFVYSIISGEERYVFNSSRYFVSPEKIGLRSSKDL